VAELHVLRVFSSKAGEFGNPLGVFLDGGEVPRERRQEIATDLNFSETVFVDDRAAGAIDIYTPAAPIPFAGHPLVGTGWLLNREDGACAELNPPAGRAPVRHSDEMTFFSAPPAWSPDFRLDRLGSPEEVDALRPEQFTDDVYAWAWIDEGAGAVRARSFVPNFGIPEDEATGSAALALAAELGRAVTVRQGGGSVIIARPLDDGLVEIGGRVTPVEVRNHDV
jgi:predicted PhzF superfamily epimerase YddE/YHI9